MAYQHGVDVQQSGDTPTLSQALLTSPDLRKKLGLSPSTGMPEAIVLSNWIISEASVSGTIIGTLSVSIEGEPWKFTLDDAAGGMFAIAGSFLVVGPTPLDFDEAPAPAVRITADNGTRQFTRTLLIGVTAAYRPLLDFSSPANSQYVGQVI